MKVAILSESAADEAALRTIIGGLLAVPVDPVSVPPLRSRGWPSVRDVLPGVLLGLHYRSDADGLVVVVDSNDSPSHEPAHETGSADGRCRLCQLRRVIEETQRRLALVAGRAAVKIAVGMAVPAIEAWYLAGIDPQVGEATWHLGPGSRSYSKLSLKKAVYGTDLPALSLETKFAIEASARLLGHLPELRTMFPGGFGCLARDLGRW